MQKCKDEWSAQFERNMPEDFKKAVSQGTYQAEQNIAMATDATYAKYEEFCGKISLYGAEGLFLQVDDSGTLVHAVNGWDPSLKREKSFLRELQRMPYGPMYRVLNKFLSGRCTPVALLKDGPIDFVGGSKKNKVTAWDIILQEIAFEKCSSTLKAWMHYWAIEMGVSGGE